MLLYQPLGDSGLQIEFANAIDRQTIIQIRRFQDIIKSRNWDFIIECVASYTTLTIFYKPLNTSYDELVALCKELEHTLSQQIHLSNVLEEVGSEPGNIIEIPVLYGGEHGPDLESVARYHGLTPDQVIDIHSKPTYLIYLIGFTPGFPYLGGMSDTIATPRLSKPRLVVKAGSVGIANNQTGIYSINSPGGWRIIGHTPTRIYEPEISKPFLLKAGDSVRFKAISKDEYDILRKQNVTV